MTRAGNYLFEQVRIYLDPKFRIEEGSWLVDFEAKTTDLMSAYVSKPEYQENEKELLYQGLRNFMTARKTRLDYIGEGICEDYFQ